MPNLFIIPMEVIVILLFFVCLRHAWRTGPETVLRLVMGVVFGVLLEMLTIEQLDAYKYGQFLFMISHVPLAIGIGWGVIIYSAMLFSEATNLSVPLRPILDGLLALSIDLAMDPVAIRLGMWDWRQGLDYQYFGVPYANFWAWFWVVLLYSAAMRLLTTYLHDFWRWLAPFGALFLALVGLFGANALYLIVPHKYFELAIGFPLFATLLLILLQKPKMLGEPPAAPAFWVPFGFHTYFLAAGLLSGVIFDTPILLVVNLSILFMTLFLHRSTYIDIVHNFQR